MVKTFRPETLSEALQILSGNPSTIIAGGTDLMAQKARGFGLKPNFDSPLMFIEHLNELKNISLEDKKIHIGACAILTDLVDSYLIPETFKEVIGKMASPPTRNLATIGGNICNASPAGDTLPFLYAMNAKLELQNYSSSRIVSIQNFIVSPKNTVLNNDELLTNIIIPNKTFDINIYRKLGQRKGMSLTKASFHGLANRSNNIINDVRIALGSVAPTIVRSNEIENLISGCSQLDLKTLIPEILERYSKLITPINDVRSTAKYRKEVSVRMIEDFLCRLVDELQK